jgi:Lrp/AsnC family leucine-responsive transcriptional regulator
MDQSDQLDEFDHAILRAVARNGRITLKDLSDKVGLSKTPCQARLKRLEKLGIIQGYRALLDPIKLGQAHIAFVEVRLSDTRAQALQEFNSTVQAFDEIEQCHMIAGHFDYLLKVRTPDITAYRRFLGESLSALPHLAHSSTHVSMESVK